MSAVVSDTGPLISLERLPNGYGFIRLLYQRIIIPTRVAAELTRGAGRSIDDYLERYGIGDLFEVRPPAVAPVIHTAVSAVEPLDFSALHDAERDAIAIAITTGLPLLIEETAGRQIAQGLGVAVSGIAGQVVKAHRLALIDGQQAESYLRGLLRGGRIGRDMYLALAKHIARR